jgi:predicted ATPase
VYKVINSPTEVQQYAEELVALSSEHGFPFFLGFGILYRGWCLTVLGQPREGLTLLTDGLGIVRATGAVIATSFALMVLAEAYAKLNQTAEGLNCVAEASAIISATNERFWESELHRVRADLLFGTGDQAAAEQSYYHALAVARRQSAKLFELRAATSLARLFFNQGKATEARDLLAPIYGWFTEGFDTPVLKDANALLDELAS